jgi:hypothetical protein
MLAAVGSTLFLALAPGTVAGLIPWWLTGWRAHGRLPGWLPVRALGVVFIVAGAAVVIDAFGRFVVQGVGTPAPVAPTERLVVGGPYRHVRNPMYLAVGRQSSARPYCSAAPSCSATPSLSPPRSAPSLSLGGADTAALVREPIRAIPRLDTGVAATPTPIQANRRPADPRRSARATVTSPPIAVGADLRGASVIAGWLAHSGAPYPGNAECKRRISSRCIRGRREAACHPVRRPSRGAADR